MDFLNLKRLTAFLSRATALIILLPFFIISFFNHPLGDDYWSADLVRRTGYWHAQVQLYNTIPPRFLALALSCLSPLSFGNFYGYKIIPIVFILSFIAAMAGLLRGLSGGGPAVPRRDCYWLAVLFTAVFMSATPGIGGGVYWVSALIVFGVGLLLFICWMSLLLAWYGGQRNGWVFSGICLCFIGMAGCNEIIAVVSLVVIVTVALYRLIKGRRIDGVSIAHLVLFALCVGFFACFKGVGNRYVLMQTPDSGHFWYSAGFSVLVSGFCMLKALTNPFWWAVILVAYAPFVRWCRGVYMVRRELFDAAARGSFLLAWLFILLIIPFIVLYLSGLHPPYRVVNMVFFFHLIGLVYFGTLLINGRIKLHLSFGRRREYRNIAVILLLAVGFLLKNNVSVAARELVSGSVVQYDREMNDRYRMILECRADSCVVPRLRHSSYTLRYDSTDLNDPHLNDYFRKEVIVQ